MNDSHVTTRELLIDYAMKMLDEVFNAKDCLSLMSQQLNIHSAACSR